MTGVDRLTLGIAIAFVVAIACGVATPYTPTPIEMVNTPETWPTPTTKLPSATPRATGTPTIANPQHTTAAGMVHFEGDVVTVNSEPVADALVEVETADNKSYTTRTDADGQWALDVPASSKYDIWCTRPSQYSCVSPCEYHVTAGGIFEFVLRQESATVTKTSVLGTVIPTAKPTEFIIILPTETALPIPLGVSAWYMEMVEADGRIHCWWYRSDLNLTQVYSAPCLDPQVWRYSR